nr:helix-turn-helix transcriptional regulator [Armatimonadota bacterium]
VYTVPHPPVHAEEPSLVRLDPRPLADAIQGLYRESLGAAEPALLHSWAHLTHAYAQRALGPNLAGSVDNRLRALWERVDAHLAHPWTVADLANVAGTSGEHLRRLCRSQMGRSPMRHVAHLRMRRAAALLSTQSYTVEAVAEQVGYENPFAFSTAFKRSLGLSPSDYRGERSAP